SSISDSGTLVPRGSGGTADAHGLGPCAERRGGSNPPFRTTFEVSRRARIDAFVIFRGVIPRYPTPPARFALPPHPLRRSRAAPSLPAICWRLVVAQGSGYVASTPLLFFSVSVFLDILTVRRTRCFRHIERSV